MSRRWGSRATGRARRWSRRRTPCSHFPIGSRLDYRNRMPARLFLDAEPWVDWSWVSAHVPTILGYLGQHVEFTLISLAGGVVISLPLGVGAQKWTALRLPALLAGLRVATVSTIGIITIASVIALGGLGGLIYQGFIESFRTPLVVGMVLCVALALVADMLLAGFKRVVVPWARTG